MRQSPWSWVSTLFATEEIPSAMVTFVSLLMFLQMDASGAEATLYCGLLFIPWVLKSFLRSWVRRTGNFTQMLHLVECLLFLSLIAVALSFPYGRPWIFAALMVTSFLCAWHELTARMYYERMLYPRFQRLFTTPKIFCSQVTVILTYGALIFLVSSLEVFFRQIKPAWSMGCYVTAGVFLLFTLYHFVVLKSPSIGNHAHSNSMSGSVRAEVHVIERIRQQPRWWMHVLALFLMVLPQSLMFYARVLYLFDTHEHGGLACTMQEIGFAQGTVGVIAFCVGITLGRKLIRKFTSERMFWQLVVTLGLSPAIYLGMTYCPPTNLMALSGCTLFAQLFFGTGLCICRVPVRKISGERYRNTINLLYIPLVAGCMIVPMSMSGWLVEMFGYQTFFLIDTLCAPASWLFVRRCRKELMAPTHL